MRGLREKKVAFLFFFSSSSLSPSLFFLFSPAQPPQKPTCTPVNRCAGPPACLASDRTDALLAAGYASSSAPQHATTPQPATGSATANHSSQPGPTPPPSPLAAAAAAACAILSIANTFCGDEIGLVIPPKFDARATPRARARLMWSPLRLEPRGGSVRRTGASSE